VNSLYSYFSTFLWFT